jgi:sugar lactone lactonase YvrE
MTAQIISKTRNELGESPAWSARENALYWVDIPAKKLHRKSFTTHLERVWMLPEYVCAVVPRASGGVVLALEHRVALFDPKTEKLETLCIPDSNPNNRSNDARCDALGRLWLGTMQNNIGLGGAANPITQSSGRLYRIDPDGTALEVLKNIGISNGLAWSNDARTMYFSDSLEPRMSAFDFDLERGNLSNVRRFSSSDRGVPDGSTMDAEGHLWNARWGAGCLVRFRPDGTVALELDLPVTQPSSCTFGGENLTTLFVTSARFGLSQTQLDANPLEGSVLALDLGVRGFSSPEFSG